MKKNVKRLIAGAVVLLVAAGIVVRIAGGNKKEEEYETRPTVAVENPKTGDITLYTDLTGTIDQSPRQLYSQRSAENFWR